MQKTRTSQNDLPAWVRRDYITGPERCAQQRFVKLANVLNKFFRGGEARRSCDETLVMLGGGREWSRLKD